MNFRRRRAEEPEINLIPFIDVLLVVLIFLMLSTTFNPVSYTHLTLPTTNKSYISCAAGPLSKNTLTTTQ